MDDNFFTRSMFIIIVKTINAVFVEEDGKIQSIQGHASASQNLELNPDDEPSLHVQSKAIRHIYQSSHLTGCENSVR